MMKSVFTILTISTCLLFSCNSNKKTGKNIYSDEGTANDSCLFKFPPLRESLKTNLFEGETTSNVLVDPRYYIWGMSVIKWKDGKYHGYYSRWPKELGFNGWLTDCEIAHAVSDNPEGPFEFVNVVLESRNKNGWDVVGSHNPSVLIAQNNIYLYYISNDLKEKLDNLSSPMNLEIREEEWNLIRNSQRIGMATATSPSGPFVRFSQPVVEPDNELFKNIAVNPAVYYIDGKYTMIMKGDDMKSGDLSDWFRIQLVGHASKPEGPFVFQKEPVYDKKQTEDAGIWYDQTAQKYYMVCHVMGQPDLALFTSKDSYKWEPATPFVFMKKEFALEDGQVWKPERVERPFVLTDENGKPIMLYVAVLDNNISGNIAIPLIYE